MNVQIEENWTTNEFAIEEYIILSWGHRVKFNDFVSPMHIAQFEVEDFGV